MPGPLASVVAAGLVGVVALGGVGLENPRSSGASARPSGASARPSGPSARPSGPSARPSAASPGPGRTDAGSTRYVWPLHPVPPVLRRFRVGPYRWSPGHRGVDLAGIAGQPVLAAGPGVVAFAARVAGRGVVVVSHGGALRTTYEPVTPGVRVGQPATAGMPIGTLEAAASHCPGPCLHWGALRGGIYVDPLSLLGLAALPVLLPDVDAVSSPRRAWPAAGGPLWCASGRCGTR